MIQNKMQAYQPIARRYRPQTFSEVVGQKMIVQTLTNAIQSSSVGHAYLFCGTRGTGKTSLARILAKALNCSDRQGSEPCNQCSSCLDITHSRSLDVIEIDGASNRGIDDAKNITETTIYSPSLGKYKIYIIDEVHMLTKEAFNALLKTLEEPPKSVKFFFATTEPQKVPSTIVSRCQRFDLKRISQEEIETRLGEIIISLQKEIDKEVIQTIARLAEGSLRDAQSLLDRVLCYDKKISKEDAAEILGLLPGSLFQSLDEAVAKGDVAFAFSFSEEIFQRGKEFTELIDELIDHFRDHLKQQLDKATPSSIYRQDDLLYLLDLLFGIRQKMKRVSKSHLEIILTKVIRCKQRISADALIQSIDRKQKSLSEKPPSPPSDPKELVSLPFSIAKKQVESEKKNAVEETPPSTDAALSLEKAHLETMLRFASIELEGTLITPPQSE